MTSDASIQFLSNEKGGRIVKSDQVLKHIQTLETKADNGGFSSSEFSEMCNILVEKSMPAQIARRFVSCMVPFQQVQGSDLAEIIMWALGSNVDNEKYLVLPILRVVNLCLDHDLVSDRRPLNYLYELFLSRLSNSTFCETIAAILLKLTSVGDVDGRRAFLIRKSSDVQGAKHYLISLRWRYRQLRPDLDPNCPPPTSRQSPSSSILCKRFLKIYENGIDNILSGLGWEPGQLAGKITFKDRQKTSVLPSAEFLNLESGLESKKNKKKTPLPIFERTEDAFKNLESLQLPNNLLAVLPTSVAANVLSRKELVERFSLVLYHTLQKEFFLLPPPRTSAEVERRKKRQVRFLQILRDFQTSCYYGLPVVGRFLSEFLDGWDGKAYFQEILGLLKMIQITEFKELYDTILAQVESRFHSFTLIQKLVVLDSYFQLLRYWSTVELSRLSEMKAGLFPDSSTNCESAFASIIDLCAHIGEIVTSTLSSAREEQDKNRALFTHFITNMYLDTQEIMLSFKVPVRLQIPQPLVHENLFCTSSVGISKMCKYLVAQKKNVLPMLKERAVYLDTVGDGKTAKTIRNQLALEQLRSLEAITRDVLLVLSPSVISHREDSLFRLGWEIKEDFVLNSFFISKHPLFLPFTLDYFKNLQLNETQKIFRGLTSDRVYCDGSGGNMFSEANSNRISSGAFYRSRGNCSISNPELNSFLLFIGESHPKVGEFLKLFCYPSKPAMSISSQSTELTESSGVSSMVPRAVNKNVKKQTENWELRRQSPRFETRNRGHKRTTDYQITNASKRNHTD